MHNYEQRDDIVKAFADFSSSPHKTYVARVFYCDEHKKLHEFTLLLTPDCFIQFGSNPPIAGRQNIENMLVEFNKQFKHLSQHIQKVFYDSPEEIVYAADATYTFDDGNNTGAIPYMVHLRFAGSLVSEYRIYIDLSPFYQMTK